ncbi:FlgB family protein [Cognatishimia sp. WU-CL00825]|uniref:FlgB family protein n=1 Tax=Cognatishimia sp. WU-CL00825 TaxID=3127658 RepID=UPI003106A2F1
MFEDLGVFKMAHAMAVHAAARQNVVAQNMANADTPGYVARRVVPFATQLRARTGPVGLQATRAAHLTAEQMGTHSPAVFLDQGQSKDPNGNNVTLESEMMQAVEVKQQHDRALAIYKAWLKMQRLSLGRR